MLKITNYVLQFFFVRLTRCEQLWKTSDGHRVYIHWYAIQYWIIPFTGWTGEFKYVGKEPNFFRITQKWYNGAKKHLV